MAGIALEGVEKAFGDARALRGLDLEIADGEFFVLLGQTGAGKTTTLRLIAGLEKPDAGRILIGGRDVAGTNAAERDVALVLQQYSLYPRLTVRGNLEFPLKAPGRAMAPAQVAARVEKAATTLQIAHLLDRKVERLSGGEMQRVSIGRAIVREPRAFLMDEPLSALDAKLREALRVELKRLHHELRATFLFVTHDQVEAMSMGDRIGVVDRGRLLQAGTPAEVYARPRTTFVAGALGTPPMNLLDGEVAGGQAALDGLAALPMATGPAALDGRPLTFGIRPEDIRLGEAGGVEGRVFDVEDHGVVKIVTMEAAGRRVRATAPARTHVQLDEVVRFGWVPEKVVVFDRATGRNLAS